MTRAARRVACLVATLLALAPVAGPAAREAPVAGEATFDEFLLAFRRALADDDREALASLTQLPFLYQGEGLDAAGFRQAIPGLFTPPVRRCLAQARPIAEDDRYVVFCSPYAFYFGRSGEGYRLIEFMADGEQ